MNRNARGLKCVGFVLLLCGPTLIAVHLGCAEIWPNAGGGRPPWRNSTTLTATERLFLAVEASKAQEVSLLLSQDADPNAVDFYGQTPLLIAAHYGFVECASVLIRSGVQVEGDRKCECSPLYEAAGMGQDEMVSLLLKNGADVDHRHAIWRDSPLHRAVEEGHARTVALLLKSGADANLRNHAGQTALHRAAFWGYGDIVQALVERGADKDIKDNTGATAADTAVGRGHAEVAKLLRNSAEFGGHP